MLVRRLLLQLYDNAAFPQVGVPRRERGGDAPIHSSGWRGEASSQA